MKTKDTLTIRFFGTAHRRFVVQRGDDAFWTGSGWSHVLDMATFFTDHHQAQLACGAIQAERNKGKPARTYRCEVVIRVVGDRVSDVTPDAVAGFMAKAIRIDVETEKHGDGPLGTYLEARMVLGKLKEVTPRRKGE